MYKINNKKSLQKQAEAVATEQVNEPKQIVEKGVEPPKTSSIKYRMMPDGSICSSTNPKLWNEQQKGDLTYLKYNQEHRYVKKIED